jgi:hypothetical protein
MSICLLTTLHDPDGKLADLTNKYFLYIRQNYDKCIIESTNPTKHSLCLDKYISYSEAGNIGESRRNCLRRGLETDCEYFHFVDFDRLLYWYMTYPEELKQVIRLIQCDKFTIIGRTKAAFDSHPDYQRITEGLINSLFMDGKYDVLAASRGITRHAAATILNNSKAINPACIDVEWCTILLRNINYIQVNGLAYESNLLGIERVYADEVWLRTQHLVEVVRMLKKWLTL